MDKLRELLTRLLETIRDNPDPTPATLLGFKREVDRVLSPDFYTTLPKPEGYRS